MARPQRNFVQQLFHRAAVSYRVRSSRIGVRRHGLEDLLRNRPGDAFPWSPVEVWSLYQNIRTRKPEVAMEFGVGCTTFTIAEAMRRNGRGRLITVDSNRHWLEEAKKGLPDELRQLVTFHYSPVEQTTHAGVPCHRYSDLPDDDLDFLYVDGPDASDVPGWGPGKPVSVDPIDMEQRFRPGFRMVVEGRLLNQVFLQKHLRRTYSVWEDARFRIMTFDLVG